MSSRYTVAVLTASLILAACIAAVLVKTASWPQISDDVLMHYVTFLLHHGKTPYRDIIDVNLPGSYAVDAAATALLGSGPGAWRLFDWLLTIAGGAAMVAIVQRQSFFAGWFAAALFALLHVSDGVAQAAQRDFILAVLLLVGMACFLRGANFGAARWIAAWGLLCGLAATIKPQAALLAAALLLFLFMHQRGRQLRSTRLLLAGGIGFLTPPALAATWLAAHGALQAFLDIARGLMLYHAGMARHSVGFLLTHALPSQLILPTALALALLLRRPRSITFEEAAVLTGVGFGLVSFCVQGKAYPYHRYPLIAFCLLFIALELAPVLKSWQQGVRVSRMESGIAALLVSYGVLWLAAASTARAFRYDWRTTPSLDALQADLRTLAAGQPDALQNNVQCMDTMAGCITVLDRMALVQATGFLYDCYFFAPGQSAVKDEMRARFLTEIEQRPPVVFVVTSQWCLNLPGGYAKLEQWPAFLQLLARHYDLRRERDWQPWNTRYLATWPFGYRIYVRRESENQAP